LNGGEDEMKTTMCFSLDTNIADKLNTIGGNKSELINYILAKRFEL